jgi:predicted  nucleic acid-binding Zn-ribbon protein
MSDQQNSEEIKPANLRDELEENKTKIQNLEKKISPLKEEFKRTNKRLQESEVTQKEFALKLKVLMLGILVIGVAVIFSKPQLQDLDEFQSKRN